MEQLNYPVRVVFEGGEDAEGMPLDGYEVHGPFREPGQLWMWANRNCYLNPYPAWREDMNGLIAANRANGLMAIKRALDAWAVQDLEEYDIPGSSHARVLHGDAAWRTWQESEAKDGDRPAAPPESWRAVGPVRSCGCEDWPCCVHADDYAYVP